MQDFSFAGFGHWIQHPILKTRLGLSNRHGFAETGLALLEVHDGVGRSLLAFAGFVK